MSDHTVSDAIVGFLGIGIGGSIGAWIVGRVMVDPAARPSDWPKRRRLGVVLALALAWGVALTFLTIYLVRG